MPDSDPILIVGASARAAAFSALRAGLRPWCVDLFADADLRARCPVRAIAAKDYPRGLIQYFREAPAAPWMYTGALENYPKLIDQLSRLRPLRGTAATVLQRVRWPREVARVLNAAGLPCPEVRMDSQDLSANKRWLVKPLAGAGGAGIEYWTSESATRRHVYYQEFIEGKPCSAVYRAPSRFPPVSGGEGWGEGGERPPITGLLPPRPHPLSPEAGKRGESGVQLLGVTEQLIGESWLNARPFRWCGNIGPISISASLQRKLESLGEVLVREFRLRGLFGVDFILRDDEPWPVEINPRYTGAVEVLEYASDEAFLGEPSPVRAQVLNSPMVGKAILFAKRDFRFPADGPWTETLRCLSPIEELPPFADIPKAGTRIEIAQPVLTMLSKCNRVDECREELRRRARQVSRLSDTADETEDS